MNAERTAPARALLICLLILVTAASACAPIPAAAQGRAPLPTASRDTLRLYGPGGPLPAMREAAAAFGRARGITVQVTGGPTPEWLERARADADLIYSGSEHMMTDFIRQMEGRVEESTVQPLYLRPSAILVRPGNPRGIRGFADLLRPGIRVLVVQGAGQTGLWEDMAGRRGEIQTVRALRRNIAAFAANSGEARQRWMQDTQIDAWIIWNIWQVANPALADLVEVEEPYRIYRDAGAALTRRGAARPEARQFLAFLQSREGAAIFARWGWTTQ
jgi:accessory colonization factor AcfC